MSNMYDALLSDITDTIEVLLCKNRKPVATFSLNGKTVKRMVHTKYFSNHGVSVIVINRTRYLVNSKVEIVEVMA